MCYDPASYERLLRNLSFLYPTNHVTSRRGSTRARVEHATSSRRAHNKLVSSTQRVYVEHRRDPLYKYARYIYLWSIVLNNLLWLIYLILGLLNYICLHIEHLLSTHYSVTNTSTRPVILERYLFTWASDILTILSIPLV